MIKSAITVAVFVLAFTIACSQAAQTLTTKVTPVPQPVAQPVQPSFRITNICFHDFNGNGIKDSGEPVIDEVKLTYEPTGIYCITNSQGIGIVNIPAGNYIVSINDSAGKFRYILPTIFDVIPIQVGLEKQITAETDPAILFPLAEGYLTIPFPNGTTETGDRAYVSINPKGAIGRNWRNDLNVRADHLGTDFLIPKYTPILAAASGVIVRSNYIIEDGNTMAIKHPDGKLTIYCHLETRIAKIGDKVTRGEKIGDSGNTGRLVGPYPHLHFQFGGFGTDRIDPYRDLTNPSSLNWWTVDNKPQYP